MKNKKTLPIIALLIVFVVYNAIIFSFSGLIGFTKAFWVSYGTAMLFFLSIAGMLVVLGQAGMTRRDWFFGIPIIKHSVLYAILTLIYSIVFLIFGNIIHIAIPITIVLVTWAVYVIMVISCLYIKQNSDNLVETNSKKSQFTRDIRARMDYICKRVDDPTIKSTFIALKDLTESTMPYTYTGKDNPEIENEIIEKLSVLESLVNSRDFNNAKPLCEEITKLLQKRNSL